ncbi:Polymerase/histidinol phosphatase-like protein [Fimicolochytrium jonesii]|uniref:Polymerase/histidinol phosphatase-like protein n=1 Tax=Fimicolochytrium jonesii TaxID=1396493 RepID=UPI0022FE0880|nr:Polymerase/histidinol phosphatase-like protein [Fimicolochytrium jonesii]KAI8818613.1 Polymerase/histidinol phosphatase-like protein [Fimicolochytrium jonesii]
MISLHSHSGQFCCHAKGTLEDVVLAAIERGFTTLGLSEHVPRSRQQDIYPDEAGLTPSDLSLTFDNYLVEARRLQQKYSSRIPLLVGAETELIHSTTLKELDELQSRHKLDYLVGSVHHVQGYPLDYDSEGYAVAEAAVGGTEALFLDYFNAQYELLSHVKPAVVGHFDLVRIFRPDHVLSDDIWAKIKRNVLKIVEYGGLVEINSRAWKKGLKDAYPQRDILRYMISAGAKFTLSDDSHGPNDIGMYYDRLYAYVKEMGLHEVFYLALDGEGQVRLESIKTANLQTVTAGTGDPLANLMSDS